MANWIALDAEGQKADGVERRMKQNIPLHKCSIGSGEVTQSAAEKFSSKDPRYAVKTKRPATKG
jgi:hypothetical protein